MERAQNDSGNVFGNCKDGVDTSDAEFLSLLIVSAFMPVFRSGGAAYWIHSQITAIHRRRRKVVCPLQYADNQSNCRTIKIDNPRENC